MSWTRHSDTPLCCPLQAFSNTASQVWCVFQLPLLRPLPTPVGLMSGSLEEYLGIFLNTKRKLKEMVRRKKSQATKGSIAGKSIKPVILGFNLLVGVAEPSEEPGVMSRGFATPSRCLSFLISKMGTIVLAGGLRSRVKEGVKDTVLSAALHTETALKETKTNTNQYSWSRRCFRLAGRLLCVRHLTAPSTSVLFI